MLLTEPEASPHIAKYQTLNQGRGCREISGIRTLIRSASAVGTIRGLNSESSLRWPKAALTIIIRLLSDRNVVIVAPLPMQAPTIVSFTSGTITMLIWTACVVTNGGPGPVAARVVFALLVPSRNTADTAKQSNNRYSLMRSSLFGIFVKTFSFQSSRGVYTFQLLKSSPFDNFLESPLCINCS